MVEQCGCLPLAIVVLGGLLATKHSWSEWQEVHRNVTSYLQGHKDYVGERKRMSKVLDLSYQELPHELKPCFLYLAGFPEDIDLEAETLYHLWIAEGFISQRDGSHETMMKIAEQKLGELAQRCMVQVKLESGEKSLSSVSRRFNSHRLHDLMRDFCLWKAKKENFLTVINYGLKDKQVQYPFYSSSMVPPTSSTGATNRKIHRLAIYLTDEDSLSDLLLLQQRGYLRYIRTLLFFYGESSIDEYQLAPFYKDSRLLKVLYFSGHLSQDIVTPQEVKIENLILLRYLSLREAAFEKLPSSLEKLRYLQTLDLRKTFSIVVPNVLWKMKGLIHLYLLDYFKFSTDGCMLRVDGLSKLETLENLAPDKVDVKGLFNLTNLRELNTIFVWEKLDLLKEVNNYLLDSGHPQLQQASIEIARCDCRSEEELRILRQLLSCHCLVRLKITGSIARLPEYNPQLYQSLTSLVLISSELKEDPMATLEKFPNLRRLHLLHRAFVRKKMVCSSQGFPSLKHLHLEDLPNLKEWRVDNAMPNLSTLVIEGCQKLEMLPDGLRFIFTLRELLIKDMNLQFKNRLRKGGEDFHKVPETTSILFEEYW